MNDLDRLLRDSLTSVQDSYAEERQADRIEARARFIKRYRRRRRIFMTGSVALAGAALIAIGAVATGNIDIFAEGPSELAGRPGEGIVARVETGRQPVDAGIGSGGIWVANAGGASLARVDPTTNELGRRINLNGSPQEVDVGEGAVWVAGFGQVTAIDPETDAVIGERVVGSVDDPISISVGEGAVWTVVGERALYRVDPATFDRQEIAGVREPVDVAARDGAVWVLDREQGLIRLDPVNGSVVGEPVQVKVGQGDISAGQGIVWIANKQSNQLTPIRSDTGAILGIFEVPGTYVDMAITSDAIWVLSQRDGKSVLTALDPQTGDVRGTPLPIAGDPVEVTIGADGVWVVDRGTGAILRIDPASVTG